MVGAYLRYEGGITKTKTKAKTKTKTKKWWEPVSDMKGEVSAGCKRIPATFPICPNWLWRGHPVRRPGHTQGKQQTKEPLNFVAFFPLYMFTSNDPNQNFWWGSVHLQIKLLLR